jgi:hypothetical protein
MDSGRPVPPANDSAISPIIQARRSVSLTKQIKAANMGVGIAPIRVSDVLFILPCAIGCQRLKD